MESKAFHRIAALLACAVLTACAGIPETPPPSLSEQLLKLGFRQGGAVATVPGFSLSGWNYINEEHIVVDNGPGSDYLLTFSFPCRDLAWMDRIGYTTTAGTFGRMDKIVGRHMGMPVNCPVAEIHKLERVERTKP